MVGQVGVRLAAPEPEQALEPVDVVGDRGPVRPVGRRPGRELARERRQCTPAGADLVGEPVGVHPLARQVQPVAVVAGQQHGRFLARPEAGLEHTSYAGEVGVQRPVRPWRRVLAPHEVDQRVGGQLASEPEGQGGQHGPGLARAELDGVRRVVPERHLAAAQHAHPHERNRSRRPARADPSRAPARLKTGPARWSHQHEGARHEPQDHRRHDRPDHLARAADPARPEPHRRRPARPDRHVRHAPRFPPRPRSVRRGHRAHPGLRGRGLDGAPGALAPDGGGAPPPPHRRGRRALAGAAPSCRGRRQRRGPHPARRHGGRARA